MRATKIEAPRCPVHVGIRMVVHERMVPVALLAGHDITKYSINRGKAKGKFFRRGKAKGKFFRCPSKGCARVQRIPWEFEDAA